MRARSATTGLLLLLALPWAGHRMPDAHGRTDGDWAAYGGDPGHSRYSTLDQITRENVRRLAVAWRYHTGDANPDALSTIECTPIIVGGTMYLTTVRTKVVALDAATGRERWAFDPYAAAPKRRQAAGGVNRGVAYWEGSTTAKRILVGTADGRLISLDAVTGRPDPDFGAAGIVDLRGGLDEDVRDLGYGVTSAPGIFENLVVVGVSVPEGPERSTPGDVRAFDVRSGKEIWRFHTVPR
jgi:quinoprotein glucose dehydrogenase